MGGGGGTKCVNIFVSISEVFVAFDPLGFLSLVEYKSSVKLESVGPLHGARSFWLCLASASASLDPDAL